MYVCDRCGDFIGSTSADPVVSISRGKFHYTCFQQVHDDAREAEENRLLARKVRKHQWAAARKRIREASDDGSE